MMKPLNIGRWIRGAPQRGILRPVGIGFSPDSLEGMHIWLDFSDPQYLFQDAAKTTPVAGDGDPIGAVADRSGNGCDATQGTAALKPIYKENVINGLSVGRFDLADDLLSYTAPVFTDASLFLVNINPDDGGVSPVNWLYFSGGSSNRYGIGARLGAVTNHYNGSSYIQQSATSFDETQANVITSRYTSSPRGVEGWVNQVAMAGSLNTGLSSGGKLLKSIGDCAEFIGFTRALSDAEIDLVENYLSAKWGVILI